MVYSHLQRVRILYKTILKLHRSLPEELQILGTNYARDEFRRHKTCNEKEADIFMSEWTDYALSLAEQLGLKGPTIGNSKIGKCLSQDAIEQLRDEQIVQLYELMGEATKINEESFER